MDTDKPLYLLTVYPKSQRDNISAETKRTLKAFATELKQAARTKGGKQ